MSQPGNFRRYRVSTLAQGEPFTAEDLARRLHVAGPGTVVTRTEHVGRVIRELRVEANRLPEDVRAALDRTSRWT